MREGWKETRLRDLCADISYGYTTSATDKVTGVKFLRITDVVPDFIDWSTVPYCEISPTNYEKTKLEVNDIVIARTGATVGYAKQIKKAVDAVNASYLVRLRLNDKAHKKYIGILVESDIFKSFVRTIAGGSAQPNANAKDLTSFKFLLPPLPLQTRIADLLSAYDELIEVNNRRIALLEQTAEQLYKEWFVRLRFPGYAQTKVRKGVPEGWDIKPLKFFGKIITGKTPSKKIESYFGGDIPFVKTPDMHGNVFVIETMETLTRSGAESQKKQTIPNGSIMVNCIGALSGSVSITSTNCQTNQQINSLVLKNSRDLEFLFFAIKQLKGAIILFGNTGSTMTNLSKGKFSQLTVLTPSRSVIEAYHSYSAPILEKIKTLMLQNQTLRRTRDLLLPRLISGQLSVAEAETALNA